MSRDCCVALPRVAMGLSAICDCGISWSYSLTIFDRVEWKMPAWQLLQKSLIWQILAFMNEIKLKKACKIKNLLLYFAIKT